MGVSQARYQTPAVSINHLGITVLKAKNLGIVPYRVDAAPLHGQRRRFRAHWILRGNFGSPWMIVGEVTRTLVRGGV